MKRRLGRSVLLAGVVMLMLLIPLLPAQSWADSFTVFVGYADNLRPSGFFPSPWLGAPGVVSQTCAGCGIIFDSGAVRIDNTGADPLAISNFKVTLNPSAGPVAINIWGSGTQLTIGPGQNGIFTQFPNNGQNFDSSDFGLFGGFPPAALEPNNADHNGNTNLIGGCSSPTSFMTSAQQTLCSANAPVISFTETNTSTLMATNVSLSDTGHILDTGEWDFVNNSAFGEDGNESINWNTIGGSNRGGTVPEPASLILLGAGLVGLGVGRRFKKL